MKRRPLIRFPGGSIRIGNPEKEQKRGVLRFAWILLWNTFLHHKRR